MIFRILAAESQKLLFVDAKIVGISTDIFHRELWIEAVIASRDRRVRGEDAGTSDATEGNGEIDGAAREARNAFERGEGGMPLVHVNDGRGLADGVQGGQPTNAQEDFLFDAVSAVAAIKVMC